ncbi:MAG: LVIVD repeat-containing protein [Candidatus Hodarchaeales archaeon]|jgi:hypothetical protein
MRRIHPLFNYIFLIFFILLSTDIHITRSYLHSTANQNIGLILLSETGTGGDAYDIWVDENKKLAYVTCGYKGLRIFNISNPSDPILLSHVSESPAVINTGHTTAYAHQLQVKDHIVFIGDGPGGLKIINCTDPENPSVITHFTEGYSWDLEIVNNVAFVANGWNNLGNPGMMVIDITNLSNPLMIYNHRDWDITDLEISENQLYLAGYDAGVAILDIMNYSNPVLLGRYTGRKGTFDIEIKDSMVFQSSWDYGLQILDVADPGNITVVSEFSDIDGGELASIHLDTDFAFLAAMSDGLIVLNVSDPSTLLEVSRYNEIEGAYGIFTRDEFVYIADQDKGFVILEMVSTGVNQKGPFGFNFLMVVLGIFIIFLNRRRRVLQ